MAESHEYSLTVHIQTDGSSQGPIAGQSNAEESIPNQSGGNLTPQTAVKALVSFNSFVKPLVQPFVDQHIQTISLRTGATETQQRIQFAYDVGKQAVGIGAGIIGGFIVGNLPGALLGASVGFLGTMTNYALKTVKMQTEQILEDISLRGVNVRAGGYAPSYSASRLGSQ